MNQELLRLIKKPMLEALERGMQELPLDVAEICQQMAKSGHDVQVAVSSVTHENETFIVETTAVTWVNRTVTTRFKVEWAGEKAPALFDLYYWEREAWPPHNKVWLYGGLVASGGVAREIAILSHGRQYPGTVMARGM